MTLRGAAGQSIATRSEPSALGALRRMSITHMPKTPLVELFYFDGCQSCEPAVENLKQALQLEQWPADVEMIHVADPADAQTKRFLGSPTIRIDGVDVEGPAAETHGYAYGCRVYTAGGRTAGWPSVDQIRQALQRGRQV